MQRISGFRTACAAAIWMIALGAPSLRAQVRNGDFEESPPGMPGWRELGSVTARPIGWSSPNSANLGSSAGIGLQSGAFMASAIWQKITHGAGSEPCYIEFAYRAGRDVTVYLEIDGPAGVYGAFLPEELLFKNFHVQYPACGNLDVSFNLIEPSSLVSVSDFFQVDDVIATPIGDVPLGQPLTLQPTWLPSPATTPLERAIVELDQLRDALGKRFSSPKDLLNGDGNSKHGFMLFSKPWVMWQQIDSTHTGSGGIPNLRSMSFRRDLNTATDPSFTTRQVEIEIVMAHADVQRMSPIMAQNYLDTPTTVVTKKTISLPDWQTQPPGPSPAAWDLNIPFDNRWTYNGVDDLLYEIRVTSNSGAPYAVFENYPIDAENVPGSFDPQRANGVSRFGGCATTGQGTGPFGLTSSFYNHRFKFSMHHSVAGAPIGAGILVNYAQVGTTHGSPLLCSAIFIGTLTSFSLGVADPNGNINRVIYDNIRYVPSFVGLSLYFQAWGLDVSQPQIPVSFSNGIEIVVPPDPQFPVAGYTYCYTNTVGGTLFQSGPWAGGLVAMFDY